jgi:hypothetical protein
LSIFQITIRAFGVAPTLIHSQNCQSVYFLVSPCAFTTTTAAATATTTQQDQGTLTEGGRLSTVDLLIVVTCFVKKENKVYNIKIR